MSASPQQKPDEARADAILLDRIVARDPSAIGDLYDRHRRLLYGLILRILRDRAEAEEVLQEVFVQVWTRAQTYTEALGSPAGWLVRIARNRAIDRLRANAVRIQVIEEAPFPSPGFGVDPEADAARRERQRCVAHALDGLPREQRVLIEDAFFLGLTHAELASRFGLPLGTVKTRIRNGLIALRQQLPETVVER